MANSENIIIKTCDRDKSGRDARHCVLDLDRERNAEFEVFGDCLVNKLWETLINFLCGRIAKFPCRAVRYSEWIQPVSIQSIYRNLNIFLYMPRFLRSVRPAQYLARTINQRFLCGKWKTSTETGFTLLELLVAVTLVAVMAVGVWAALDLCVRAWTRGIVTIEVNQRERSTQDLVRKQIASAYPAIPPSGALNPGALTFATSSPAFIGGETSLRFITPNSLFSMDSTGLVVASYEVEIDSDGNIALVGREALYTGQSISDGGFTSAAFIFFNLSECIFEYYYPGDTNNPAEWLTEWDTASRRRLPAAVRISMLFQDPESNPPGMQMVIPLRAQYNFLQVQQPLQQYIQRRQQRLKPNPKAKADL